MRPKSILLLALALGCGLIASIGIGQVMNKDDSKEVVEKVQVFVAKVNIPFGEKITAEMVVVENWPKSTVPPGVLKKIEDIVDQSPRNQILEGFPIVESMLGADEKRASSGIREGYQTVAVRLSSDQGANLLQVGDRVDVQVYLRRGAAPGIDEAMLQTILQDVGVFAVNQKFQNSSDEDDQGAGANAIITLQVKPEEARWINLAKSVGEILLTVRNVTDKSDEETEPLSLDVVLGRQSGSEREDTTAGSGDEKSGGPLSDFLDQQTDDQPKAIEPAEDEVVFEMEKWEAGQLIRFTFCDVTKPPRELSAVAPQPETPSADGGAASSDEPADKDPPTAEPDKTEGSGGGLELPGEGDGNLPDNN